MDLSVDVEMTGCFDVVVHCSEDPEDRNERPVVVYVHHMSSRRAFQDLIGILEHGK